MEIFYDNHSEEKSRNIITNHEHHIRHDEAHTNSSFPVLPPHTHHTKVIVFDVVTWNGNRKTQWKIVIENHIKCSKHEVEQNSISWPDEWKMSLEEEKSMLLSLTC